MRSPSAAFRSLLVLSALWLLASPAIATGAGGKPKEPVVPDLKSGLTPAPLPSVTFCDPKLHCLPRRKSACLEQTFPETAWRVCIQDMGKKGLWIGPVDLRRAPGASWMRVLYEAGLTEIFVPYHQGTDRLRDMQYCPDADHPDRCHRTVTPADAGPNGFLVTLLEDSQPRVVAEVRDRGMAWLCKWRENGQERSLGRRGEELLLWGVYDTGNYDYLIQYGLRDDGTLTFRLGATGWNNNNFPAAAHMHTSLWRLDVDLNGSGGDTALVSRHREGFPNAMAATDVEIPFNGGLEGYADWLPGQFTALLVEDQGTNVHGNHLAYELVPLRRGTSRHFGPAEVYTLHDFWVTVYRGTEAGFVAPYDWHTNEQRDPDTYLTTTAQLDGSGKLNPEPVTNTDLVLWHLAADHHEPHDEDQAEGDSSAGYKGVTLMHWMGFDLVPHNVFDHNPLGGPHRSQCDGPQ